MKRKIAPLVKSLAVAGSLWLPNAMADDLWQIYQLALSTDPTYLQAAADKETAFEAINESRATLLPQINLSADYSDVSSNRDARETDGTTLSVGLNQEIYHHDSWISLGISEKVAHRSDLTFSLAKQQLMQRVTQAYFDVLSAIDDLEFIQAEKKAIGRQLEQTKQRFAVGLTAITDVHEAQAEYDRSVADEIVFQNTLTNSYEGLREITGKVHRDLKLLNTAKFSPSRPEPVSADAWEDISEAQSLSIAIDKVSLEVADESIELAQSGHYPTFDFFAQYNSSNMDNDLPGPDSYDDTIFGVQLNVPIYTGGATTSQVEQARSNYVAASEALVSTHRSTIRSTRNAYNTVGATISAIKAFEQTVISRQSALEATEAGFEVGTRTIVDVLDATRFLFEAKAQLSSARYAYVLSVIDLKIAAGTLTEQDIEDINTGLVAR